MSKRSRRNKRKNSHRVNAPPRPIEVPEKVPAGWKTWTRIVPSGAAGVLFLLFLYFYWYSPAVVFSVLGERWGTPIPIAFGEQILPFALSTSARYPIRVKTLRVDWAPGEIELIPNPARGTRLIAMTGSNQFNYGLSFDLNENKLLDSKMPWFTGVRFRAAEHSAPFRLRFYAETQADVRDFLSFLREPPIRSFEQVFTFTPIGMPTMSPKDQFEKYALHIPGNFVGRRQFGELQETDMEYDIPQGVTEITSFDDAGNVEKQKVPKSVRFFRHPKASSSRQNERATRTGAR